MPSPIPATAYGTSPVPQPTAFRAPAREAVAPSRDLFGQGASGQDMAVIGAAPTHVSTVDESAATATAGHPMFGKDGFTFSDFLDIINPLQHIPVVNTVYRAITGDKIDPGARLIGGGLFGGPIGLVASMVSGMVEEATGKDPGEHALAALGIDIGPRNAAPEAILAEQPGDMTPTELAALQARDAEQAAPLQAAQAKQTPEQDRRFGIREDSGKGAARTQPQSQPVKSDGPIELPADLFQALKQSAATQQQDARTAAANTATANPVPQQQPAQAHSHGPMQTNTTNAMPNTGITPTAISPGGMQTTADGRTWFPAFPVGGAMPARAAGTSPVTQQNATSKFGSAKAAPAPASPTPQGAAAASAAAMLIGQQENAQNEWANRASDAYQKYFDMQNERNRRAGIVP